VRQPRPGEFVINTPAGLTYHVDPEAVGPITDPRPDESGCDPPDQDDQSMDNVDQPDDPPF
jgi:hypothetical protein